MPIRSYAQSFKVTATAASTAYKLTGRPLSVLEVRNLGKGPVYARLGNDTVAVRAISETPTWSVYIGPGESRDFDVIHRTHIALVAPEKDCDVLVMQGAG